MKAESRKFKIKTAYNDIDVHQRHGRFELRSADNALQSVVDLQTPYRLMLRNLEHLLAVLLFIPEPERVLMLGTAAGSLLHYLRHYFPRSEITAVDIDVELVEQLLQLRVLPPAGDGLSYVYDDAAHYIAHCNRDYDLVLIDIFTGAQSPRWLLDKQSTDNLYRLIGARGALAYNLLIDSEHDFRLFYRDLRLVFSQRTLCMPVKGYENTIAYGFRFQPPERDMAWYLQHAADQSSRLGIDFVPILSLLYNTNPVRQGVL